MRHALILIAVTVITAGCSGERNPRSLLSPKGGGTIVIDARLIVGQDFPDIELRETQSPDQPYSASALRLEDATLILTTAPDDTIWYVDAGDNYHAYNGTVPDRVEPHTTYHLQVTASDGRVLTAETTTPDSLRVREWVLIDNATLAVRRRLATPEYPHNVDRFSATLDSVYVTEANQLIYEDGLVEARFDRGQALAFQMAIFNLEDRSPLLIDADFLSDADKASLARESSSPPLDAPDGFTRLPWLAVWFEGRHRFVVYSVDRNWYDLARSIRFYGPEGLGFGSNAGDDFERPIFHVQGGIGLFGSAAMDWTGFTVHPKP